MLLPHLLPFLDAEIDRLQKARDLLATPSSPLLTHLDVVGVQALLQQRPVEVEPIKLPWQENTRYVAQPAAVASPLGGAQAVMVVKPYDPHRTERMPRRRHAAAVDTALRGSVPAGPVVVSAEAVRQAQAAKSPAPSRADEISAPIWRDQSPNRGAREINALLQKLIDIGRDDKALPLSGPAPLFG